MKFICLGSRLLTGGATMSAVLIAKSIIARGHECEVWFFMRSGKLNIDGVKTRIFLDKNPENIKDWLVILKLYFSSIREYKADAIISFYSLSNILGSLSKLCGGTKRFVATQAKPVQEQNKLLFWLEMFVGSTPLYDTNITVSQYVANSCKKFPPSYKKKLRVVYNGVPPLPPISQSQKECRKKLSLPLDCTLVGSLGRLDPPKKVDALIKMMPFQPNIHLVIAGTGTLDNELKKMCINLGVEDRVIFVGNLKGESVSMFYRAIDIFAFATESEGFGLTLIESLSMGTPVIASDIEVLREVGGSAILFADNNPKSWAQAVKELSGYDADKLKITIERGYEQAKKFNFNKMCNSYFEEVTFKRKLCGF